ncbi:amino acid permease/ SLC12A domain-containing protein [Phakopsora pachyrhizi]|nr:amino acid permease/ SLC12A domain-containing protein [Phakopsora pachyrhizi]
MGTIVYSMMVALGEMVTIYPITASFMHYATKFVDPSLGFAVGINYWYSFAVTLPTEITAASIVVQYWTRNVHVAIWITIFLVTICGINFFGVRWYGEAEFWFSGIKVTAIVMLIILGIVIDLGGTPSKDRIGFRYWISPGPFTQFSGISGPTGRFLAFWNVFLQSSFSYGGTEVVALTAGEALNPRKSVPNAIKTVFFRILLFYVGGVTIIGLLVPSNSTRLLGQSNDAASSPFVIAIENAGISVLPDIVNAVILVAAYSAGNSNMYAGSRILYGLASDNMVPSIFKKCSKSGKPLAGLTITGLFGLLAFMNVNSDGETVFNWLYNISAITGLFTWWTILLTYLRFYAGLKYQGINRDQFYFRAPFQPYLSYYGIVMVTLVIIFNGFTVFLKGNWSWSKFIAAYITIPLFICSFLGWKFVKKSKFVKVEDMMFLSNKLKDLKEISKV